MCKRIVLLILSLQKRPFELQELTLDGWLGTGGGCDKKSKIPNRLHTCSKLEFKIQNNEQNSIRRYGWGSCRF